MKRHAPITLEPNQWRGEEISLRYKRQRFELIGFDRDDRGRFYAEWITRCITCKEETVSVSGLTLIRPRRRCAACAKKFVERRFGKPKPKPPKPPRARKRYEPKPRKPP